IADLVADRRALTPSEAAELVVPSAAELRIALDRLATGLNAALLRQSKRMRLAVETLAGRRCFRKPLEMIHNRQQRLDELDARMRRRMTQATCDARAKIAAV